ncbi:MAG TPA: SGNH/GDSL hydrolase family protein [Jatrophihabitantaceae bacterium]|jgi:lysophospholipase L1-like esterase
MRAFRPSVLLALALLVGAGLTAPAAAASPAAHRYVALGDSYASVGDIQDWRTDPTGCARASDNYPSDVAATINPQTFVDISCGGATTVDMTQSQSVPLGSNPPQFSALTPDTDLVTLTIGGNDIGFASIVATCAALSVTNPVGKPCQQHYTSGGADQLQAAIAQTAPKVDAVLAGIQARAPHARIVVVGYLRILPPSGGCWPLVPIARGDVPWLNTIEHSLNAMLGTEASAHGASAVNPGETTGHDACQTPADKWVEGLIPTSTSIVPVHPNGAGQAHVASLVTGALAAG